MKLKFLLPTVILHIALYLLHFNSFAQINFNIVANIDVQADFFTTDNQGNVYVVRANELTKYDKKGKLLYKYSNKNFGNIDFVDASNMLRLLVFYKNFSQIVFLDNTLSLNGESVSLDKIGFQQTQLVCSSHNSGLWLYDQQNLELVRLDQTLGKIQQTGNLNLLLNIDMQPNYLMEYDNKVYLNNPSSGILIFDIYGTYYKTIPIKMVKSFQPMGDLVYYISDHKIKAYNTKTTEELEFETPSAEFQNFRLEMGVLFLQTPKAISINTAQ
ncbi:MAG: hypothetical protein Q7W13_06425 [Bacteroidia bacterium]|nr:hypothetical protein [Bacteroidia bacterium]